MRALNSEDLIYCRERAALGDSLVDSVADYLGERQLGDGIWRIFSQTYPRCGGVKEWNASTTWKFEWNVHENAFHAFGEDVFGNQLVLRNPGDPVMIWNHESGELVDLALPVIELLETCVVSGLDWIDFYPANALAVAQVKGPEVDAESHLHWTQPLILGGAVIIENTSIVQRRQHLLGHAVLWRQLSGLEPGSRVIVKP